jgi:hypothetical protein
MIVNVTGADVWTPRDAAVLLEGLAESYGVMTERAAGFRDNQVADGVPPDGRPIGFITTCEDNYASVHSALAVAAAEANRLCAVIDDTVGSNDDVAAMQQDGALNPELNR